MHPGVAMNRPRPYGPLCRLKPAFQASGAMPVMANPAQLLCHGNWSAAHAVVPMLSQHEVGAEG